MLRRQSDLLLGIVLTLILIGLAVSSILPPFLQGLVAFPIVLFVPGNALIRAIFPEANLTRLDRFLFTVGLSLGVVVLSGLALNITPWGLQTKSWLWILSLVILVTSVIALWRRWQISDMELTPVEFYIPLRQILLLGLAIVVIGLALKLTLTPHLPDKIQGYTSLWILPEPGTQSDVLLIGIHSQELETTNYSLQITYNGEAIQKFPDISLESGSQWQYNISVPSGQGLVEAVLYRVDSPGIIYRHVSFTLNK